MSLSGQQPRVQAEPNKLTSLRNSNHIRDIGHENAAFELQLGEFVTWLGPRGFCLVLLVLGLGLDNLLAAEQNALEEIYLILKEKKSAKAERAASTTPDNSYAYVFFLVSSLASDDRVDSVQEQLAKLVYAVFLPVINARDQVFQCLVQEGAVHCLVSPLQHALGGVDAGCEIRPRRFIFALFQQILGNVSWILASLHPERRTLRRSGYLTRRCMGFRRKPSRVLKSHATGWSAVWILSNDWLASWPAFRWLAMKG